MYLLAKIIIIIICIEKKLKNPNNTRLISPIGSDSITIFSSKNRTVSIRLASLDER